MCVKTASSHLILGCCKWEDDLHSRKLPQNLWRSGDRRVRNTRSIANCSVAATSKETENYKTCAEWLLRTPRDPHKEEKQATATEILHLPPPPPPMTQEPLMAQGLLIIQASRSHSARRITHGRTPLDEWSVRRRDLCLATHNTHKRHTHPCPRRDSSPQSQHTNGSRPAL
jgi:hypothetical protein